MGPMKADDDIVCIIGESTSFKMPGVINCNSSCLYRLIGKHLQTLPHVDILLFSTYSANIPGTWYELRSKHLKRKMSVSNSMKNESEVSMTSAGVTLDGDERETTRLSHEQPKAISMIRSKSMDSLGTFSCLTSVDDKDHMDETTRLPHEQPKAIAMIRSKSMDSLCTFSCLTSVDDKDRTDMSCCSMMDRSVFSTPSCLAFLDDLQELMDQLDHQVEDERKYFVKRTPNDRDVCFKKITHPGTKKWHEAVDLFSSNKNEFPSWQNEICDKILTHLKNECGIDSFLICRNGDGKPSESTKNGNWCLAKNEEVLAKTKQRFNDDRKPKPDNTDTSGEKRGPGRPRKEKENKEMIPKETAVATTSSSLDLMAFLGEGLAKLRLVIETKQSHEQAPPQYDLLKVGKDLQFINQFYRRMMEAALSHAPAIMNTDSKNCISRSNVSYLIEHYNSRIGAFAETSGSLEISRNQELAFSGILPMSGVLTRTRSSKESVPRTTHDRRRYDPNSLQIGLFAETSRSPEISSKQELGSFRVLPMPGFPTRTRSSQESVPRPIHNTRRYDPNSNEAQTPPSTEVVVGRSDDEEMSQLSATAASEGNMTGYHTYPLTSHRVTNLQPSKAPLRRRMNHDLTFAQEALHNIPDWYKPIACELLFTRDACKLISRKLTDITWKNKFANLNAEDFGRIIAKVSFLP